MGIPREGTRDPHIWSPCYTAVLHPTLHFLIKSKACRADSSLEGGNMRNFRTQRSQISEWVERGLEVMLGPPNLLAQRKINLTEDQPYSPSLFPQIRHFKAPRCQWTCPAWRAPAKMHGHAGTKAHSSHNKVPFWVRQVRPGSHHRVSGPPEPSKFFVGEPQVPVSNPHWLSPSATCP